MCILGMRHTYSLRHLLLLNLDNLSCQVESRQSFLSSDKSLVECATYVDCCDATVQ